MAKLVGVDVPVLYPLVKVNILVELVKTLTAKKANDIGWGRGVCRSVEVLSR